MQPVDSSCGHAYSLSNHALHERQGRCMFLQRKCSAGAELQPLRRIKSKPLRHRKSLVLSICGEVASIALHAPPGAWECCHRSDEARSCEPYRIPQPRIPNAGLVRRNAFQIDGWGFV